MPAWFSIYCQDRIDDIESTQLKRGLGPSDWWTEAENYEIDEALVDPALALLKIERVSNGFELIYRPEGQRQLAIHLLSTPETVYEVVGEALESLEGDSRDKADRIRSHLAGVVSVVGIEMGFSQLEDMGIVFAHEVARWFGQYRNGMLKDDADDWFLMDDGVYVRM